MDTHVCTMTCCGNNVRRDGIWGACPRGERAPASVRGERAPASKRSPLAAHSSAIMADLPLGETPHMGFGAYGAHVPMA
eukprot:3516363-Alexandrium_andersonii.AAC.1